METLKELVFKEFGKHFELRPAGTLESSLSGDRFEFSLNFQFCSNGCWIVVKVLPKSRFYKLNRKKTIKVMDKVWDCCELFSLGGLFVVEPQDKQMAERILKVLREVGVHRVDCVAVCTLKDFKDAVGSITQLVKEAKHDAVIRSERSGSELAN